eukprot:Em0009g98a
MVLNFEEAVEFLRGVPLPCWLFFSFIVFGAHVGHVSGVQDFNIYRMQHFDLHGTHHGSRSAVINMEAKGEEATNLGRKCVVLRWPDLSAERFRGVVDRGAGAVVVLLPKDWNEVETSVLEGWRELESMLLQEEIPIPVYLAWEDEAFAGIYSQLTTAAQADKNSSAAGELISLFMGQGYQFITSDPEPDVVKDPQVVSLVGKLKGQGLDSHLPSIAVVAHYDAMGLATSLSNGIDSNGSGTVALLELARLFSRLYSDAKQRPKYNLLFVLTGAGKLNYFGTKHLLDEQQEDTDSSLVGVDYALCLDSLAADDSQLYLHVSKPPKEGTKAFQLLEALNQSAGVQDFSVGLVHRKIRLGGDALAWEHECFSLKHIPAATLSHFQSHLDQRRSSMFVDRSHVSVNVLSKNIKTIAEALARHIFNLSLVDQDGTAELFVGDNSLDPDYIGSLMRSLSSQPRSPQLLLNGSPLLAFLEQTLAKYSHELTRHVHQPDKTDPEFVLYSVPTTTLQAYRVKPAIFDLFLALSILAYAGVWYMLVLLYPKYSLYVPALKKVKSA